MPSAATWTDLENSTLSEVSRTEKEKRVVSMRNLKQDANERVYKTEVDSQTQRTDWWLPREKRAV